MNDLIRREDAIDALGEEPIVWEEWTDEYNKGMRTLWAVAKRDIESLPSIDAVPTASISRIEKELHGRDVEMQYEIIRWLWNYAKQFTDSRSAILQWLRGEES